MDREPASSTSLSRYATCHPGEGSRPTLPSPGGTFSAQATCGEAVSGRRLWSPASWVQIRTLTPVAGRCVLSCQGRAHCVAVRTQWVKLRALGGLTCGKAPGSQHRHRHRCCAIYRGQPSLGPATGITEVRPSPPTVLSPTNTSPKGHIRPAVSTSSAHLPAGVASERLREPHSAARPAGREARPLGETGSSSVTWAR